MEIAGPAQTRLRHVHFRMQADQRHARHAIELPYPDAGIREQFLELQTLLHETLGEPWTWEPHATDEHGQPLARIGTALQPANVFERDDWPALISFFKPRLLALDAFWTDAQWSFEGVEVGGGVGLQVARNALNGVVVWGWEAGGGARKHL